MDKKIHTVSPLLEPPIQDHDMPEDIFSQELVQRITAAFNAFEFESGQAADIAQHIMDATVSVALEDSVPMHSWFAHCAAYAEEKKEYYHESLKTLEMTSVKDSSKKVAEQKGGVRSTALYLKTQQAYLRCQRIERLCKGLMESMKMRAEIARTRSANQRVEKVPSSWDHNKF